MDEEEFKLDLEVDDELVQGSTQSPLAIFMEGLSQTSSRKSTATTSRKRQPPRNYSPDERDSSHLLMEQPSTSTLKLEENDEENIISAKRPRKAITSRFSPTPSSIPPPTPISKSASTRTIDKVSLIDLINAVKKTKNSDFSFPFPDMLNKRKTSGKTNAAATNESNGNPRNPKSRSGSGSAFIKLRHSSRQSRSSRGVDSAERNIIKTEEGISHQATPRLTAEVAPILVAGVSRDCHDLTETGNFSEVSEWKSPEDPSSVACSFEAKEENEHVVDEPRGDEKNEREHGVASSSLSGSRRSQKNKPIIATMPASSDNDSRLRRSGRSAAPTPKMREQIASGASGTIVIDTPTITPPPNSALEILQQMERIRKSRNVLIREINRRCKESPKRRSKNTDEQKTEGPVHPPNNAVESPTAVNVSSDAVKKPKCRVTDGECLRPGTSAETNDEMLSETLPDIIGEGEDNAPLIHDGANEEALLVDQQILIAAPREDHVIGLVEEQNNTTTSNNSSTDAEELEPFVAVTSRSSPGADVKIENVNNDLDTGHDDVISGQMDPSSSVDHPSPEEDLNASLSDNLTTVNASFADPPRTGRGKGNLLSQCPPEIAKNDTPGRIRSRRTIRPTRFDDYVTDGVRPGTSKLDSSKETFVINSDKPNENDDAPHGKALEFESLIGTRVQNMNENKSRKPFKLKLKLGSDKSVQIIDDADILSETDSTADVMDTTVETIPGVPTPVILPVKKEKKQPRPPRFELSFKEAIPDLVRPDGTVEKLGMAVNKVMDGLLEAVCNDGITRHISIMSDKQRRQFNSRKATDRYYKEKEQREQYLNDCRLRGVEPNIPATTKLRHSDIVSSCHRSERTTKGALYNEVRHNLLPKRKGEERGKLGTPDTDPDFTVPSKKSRGGFSSVDPRYSSDREQSWFSKDESEDGACESDYEEYERVESILAKEGCYGLVDKYSLLQQADLTTEHDFFYRDVLADVVSASPSHFFDEDVDIDTVDPVQTGSHAKDLSNRGSTDGLASNIEVLLMRPASPYGISDLFARSQEESELHRAILDRAVDIILDYHSAGNSTMNESWNDLSAVNSGCHSSVALRDLFSMYYSDRKPAILWVHRFLVEFLPVEFLASYMNLLKSCRTMRFLVVKKIIMETVALDDPWPRITEDILTTTKPSSSVKDAINLQLDSTVAAKCMGDVVFLILAPPVDDEARSSRHSHIAPLFKWITKIGNNDSQIWNAYEELDSNCNIAEYGDFVVQKIVDKVSSYRKSRHESRIVIVGYRTSCFFAHRAAQVTHGISAIIDISFPLITSEGPRGDPDDDILLTYCPSLFIVGADADDFDPVPMKDMRNLMISRTGLVVVSHADEHLNVSTSVLSQAGITQAYVFRTILEHIYDFLRLDETMQERTKLAPLQLNRLPFHISAALLENSHTVKAPKSSSANEPAKKPRKRKADANSSVQEVSVKPTDPRHIFVESLKRARTDPFGGKPASHEFKVPMVPQHMAPDDYKPMPSASTSSYVDPASISLG